MLSYIGSSSSNIDIGHDDNKGMLLDVKGTWIETERPASNMEFATRNHGSPGTA